MKKLRPGTTRDRSYQHTSLTAMVVLRTWWWVILGKLIRAFKQFIAETAILAGSQSDAGNTTPANWTDAGKKDAVKLIKSDSR